MRDAGVQPKCCQVPAGDQGPLRVVSERTAAEQYDRRFLSVNGMDRPGAGIRLHAL